MSTNADAHETVYPPDKWLLEEARKLHVDGLALHGLLQLDQDSQNTTRDSDRAGWTEHASLHVWGLGYADRSGSGKTRKA